SALLHKHITFRAMNASQNARRVCESVSRERKSPLLGCLAHLHLHIYNKLSIVHRAFLSLSSLSSFTLSLFLSFSFSLPLTFSLSSLSLSLYLFLSSSPFF